MRLAVVADIHGNAAALRAVVADLAAAAPDLVVNLGDCLSGPLQAAETADHLRALDWPTVRGNHDRWLVEQSLAEMGASDRHAAGEIGPAHRAWLAALPAMLAPADGVLAVHATPASDTTYLAEDVAADGTVRTAPPDAVAARLGSCRAGLVLHGHSHVPRLIHLADGTLVVNPGSVGLPAYTDDTPVPHVMAAGSPHARYAILDRGPAGWSATFRAVVYDWDAAARLAATRGRPDWAEGLATGAIARG
jgi:predicted phosphodiesterase